jgi:ABC-type nitrate/sulfonate/bicarbonate transport system ATPase subunit
MDLKPYKEFSKAFSIFKHNPSEALTSGNRTVFLQNERDSIKALIPVGFPSSNNKEIISNN